MEIIILKHRATKQALSTLDTGIKRLAVMDITAENYSMMRDGLIQRFEYCIDSFWKFLKLYLEDVHKVSITSPSPRSILKISLASAIMSDYEYDILLKCVSDRNLTSHTYDEETAEKIQEHILLYYETMIAIINRLEMDK